MKERKNISNGYLRETTVTPRLLLKFLKTEKNVIEKYSLYPIISYINTNQKLAFLGIVVFFIMFLTYMNNTPYQQCVDTEIKMGSTKSMNKSYCTTKK